MKRCRRKSVRPTLETLECVKLEKSGNAILESMELLGKQYKKRIPKGIQFTKAPSIELIGQPPSLGANLVDVEWGDYIVKEGSKCNAYKPSEFKEKFTEVK